MSPAVSVLHTWRVGVEEGGKARRGGASFAGASIPRKLSPRASKSPPSRTPHHIYRHPTDLFPTNPLHHPRNPQFLKILPGAQVRSEERGREMPSQQPAFGTLVETCKEAPSVAHLP